MDRFDNMADQSPAASDPLADSDPELLFRAMADFMPHLVWFTDHHGGTIWYNRRWYEFTGSDPDEAEGWGWTESVHPDHAERVVEGFRRAWEAGADWEDTYPLRRHDGEYHWFLSRAAPLWDSEGRLIRWFGTNTDINDRMEAERLQRLLTQEVSHRVKNNLALVSSLLNMQAREVEGDAREAIREAALRVSTVGQLHDLFWRHSTARTLDLSLMVTELCGALQETWPVHRLICHAEPIKVHVSKAIPLALILNELVTNAFKHGYPIEQAGEVKVTLTCAASDEIRLQVRDFGRGLPHGFDMKEFQDSLGMKVVVALARQLKGKLQVEEVQQGACFLVTAPARGR